MIFKRFRIYRQIECNECGIACIRMIMRNYGHSISNKQLKQICDPTRLGITVTDIVDTLHKLDMNACALKLEISHFKRMPLPAILHWDQNHFVVLYKINHCTNRFYIADPSKGKYSIRLSDFIEHWCGDSDGKGILILAEPSSNIKSNNFRKEKSFKPFVKYLFDLSKSVRKQLGLIMLFAIITMASDTVMPFMMRNTVDEGIANKNINLIWLLLFAQIAITFGYLVSNAFFNIILTKINITIGNHILKRFFYNLIRFPIAYFDKKITFNFIQKIEDQERIKDFLLSIPQSLIITTLSVIVYSCILCLFSFKVFIIFLFLTFADIVWNSAFMKKLAFIDAENFHLSSKHRNNIYELVNGMPDIKISNGENSSIRQWKNNFDKLNQLSLKSTKQNALITGGSDIIMRLKDLLVTGICASCVVYGDITIGTMLTLSYFVGRLGVPVHNLILQMSIIQNVMISFERIEDIIDPEKEKKVCLSPNDDSISFQNVFFKYPGSSSPYILKDISISIQSGKVIAIVGESGCGKSTLIKLMAGLYQPDKGHLILGKIDIKNLDIESWLHRCGAVLQGGYIFSRNILENIAISDNHPSTEKAEEALKQVGMLEFINNMPLGLNTRLGANGMTLSGGQQQRLLIARALYKHPSILFLDEATSSLDANNEKIIMNNLLNNKGTKTIIIAAHRLSTIRNADLILYLENGTITEQGTHQQLMDLKGRYYNLVNKQDDFSGEMAPGFGKNL